MKRLQIAKPYPGELAAWNEIVDPILDKSFATIHQVQTLAALRDTRLPRLISGQLRQPEAEAVIASAL